MMKLIMTILIILLLQCAFQGVSSGKLTVIQNPDVSVMEGNPVNLNCCCTGEFERVKLEWKKNQTLLKKGTFQSNSGCLILAFPKIKHEDSGRYVCKARVEIPLLIVDEGNGTTINVTDNMDDGTREDSDSPSTTNLPLVVPLASLGPFILIALICWCRQRRKQELAVRVIYEVPHIDSEVDKHSTGSSESGTKWCQVPVYESFDYFEGVETDCSK
ncbi:uncharacterized protein LOC114480285 isoform X4 [Gouania willdenowi]|uniref:uncharacterized protein LOC114480285 isoform X4 n=1 Tax=Gouania willdenowi TaxID=441366 RepID=UPI001055AA8B|nr:uncharacterized protein LOC114480285 isoform X4 [Gouania willdenowi]